MRNIFTISVCILVALIESTAFAQKKVAILGSSTAAGYGASVYDSSWVGRLQASFRKNTSDGMDTIIDNRAMPGYVTYQSLPSDYSVPPNRPAPDPLRNVTFVLNDVPRADVVIINYPTNDIVNGYDPKEMMDNLRLMFQQFNTNGIQCFVSTSQPRNTTTEAQRTILRQIVDSIKNNFGMYAINFWDDLVTNDGTNMLQPDLTPDGTHPNDRGHRFLFQRVQEKNIFAITAGASLPLALLNWQAILENKSVQLKWTTANEEPNTFFEVQRSTNGKDFEILHQIKAGGQINYSWTDVSPFSGKNFYRLKINELGKTSYSKIIMVMSDKKQIVSNLYADASVLHVQIAGTVNQRAEFDIINLSGVIVKKQYFNLNSGTISLSIGELPSGNYFLKIISSNDMTDIERFTKMK